jgi:peroxiredoxin Q/BCP
MIREGQAAPNFSLQDKEGNSVRLGDFKGKRVVLYFYPKDMTTGCTAEACDFQASWPAIKKAGAVVLGVSPDSPERHKKFASEYHLQFTLLADPDHKVSDAYGVWKEKSMYGRKFFGIERSTFLIDEAGKVAKAWTKVRVKGHVAEILETLRNSP